MHSSSCVSYPQSGITYVFQDVSITLNAYMWIKIEKQRIYGRIILGLDIVALTLLCSSQVIKGYERMDGN